MATLTSEKAKMAGQPGLVEPFLARVNDCVKQVNDNYPGEMLFWVRGNGSINGPLHADKDVDLMELQLDKVATFAHWNKIEPPIERPVGMGVRRLPALETLVPLADAIKKMGSKPFWKVELTWPLTPEAKRPFYTFELADGTVVRVDA
ncbi:MAG TPA: hypothetical protein DD490_22345 [Acidobacteria bacterium]|nr:hypothetical protein [Acidobacteriota bacterium]